MEKKKIVLKNFTEDELKEFMKTIDESPLEEVKYSLGYIRVQKLLMI